MSYKEIMDKSRKRKEKNKTFAEGNHLSSKLKIKKILKVVKIILTVVSVIAFLFSIALVYYFKKTTVGMGCAIVSGAILIFMYSSGNSGDGDPSIGPDVGL